MSNKPISIYLLGDGGVGKSALTLRFVNNIYTEEYDPTIEDTYLKNVTVDGIKRLIEIVDTAGQEEYVSMRNMWTNNADAILIVYSIENKLSFDNLQSIMDQICRLKDNSIPIILVGNKCDLFKKEVTKNDGIELAKKWNVPFFETSAKEDINTKKVFFDLIRKYIINKSKTTIDNRDIRNNKNCRCTIL
jgi:small GTP-binding protein